MSDKPYPGQDSHQIKTGGNKERGFPVGTIHNGRQKVSNNPSKWVDLQSGQGYDEHNDTQGHQHKYANLDEGHKKVEQAIAEKLHPEDHAQAKKMLKAWVDKKISAKNLQHAANVHSSVHGELSKPHTGNAQKAFDEAKKAHAELVKFISQSVQRKANDERQGKGQSASA